MRIALGIEYDGYPYHGWQAQTGLDTVQEKLEMALSCIAAEPIHVFCAGRTDAGVHGIGQVVHFDTLAIRDLKAWKLGVNAMLPPSIAVKWAQVVPETFHARFSALSRGYRYLICNQATRPAIFAHKATWCRSPLNLEWMRAGAKHFLGEQDFTSFRSSRCEAKTATREVQSLRVERFQQFVWLEIRANAFLHHMVRNITGVLLRVGLGALTPDEVAPIIQAKDRRQAFETAVPDGLYLIDVEYPPEFAIPRISQTEWNFGCLV